MQNQLNLVTECRTKAEVFLFKTKWKQIYWEHFQGKDWLGFQQRLVFLNWIKSKLPLAIIVNIFFYQETLHLQTIKIEFTSKFKACIFKYLYRKVCLSPMFYLMFHGTSIRMLGHENNFTRCILMWEGL